MKIKRAVFTLLISIAVIAAVLGMTDRVIHAQNSGVSDPAVLAKLDEILRGQKSISDDLAAMREELRIIKIRITQSQ